jgi:hypothetical protein
MSLYIHPENQRVLWTTINKANGFSEKRDADEWFKQVIAHFYHQNSHRVLSREDLLKLNKETIEYMIQQLKLTSYSSNYIAASVPTSVPASATASVPTPIASLDPDAKISPEEMNARLNFRSLQDQIDELREEIRALKKLT